MLYTNDEADKSQRKKDFLLKVVALPIVAGAICLGLLYTADLRHLLPPVEVKSGYWMVLVVMLLLYTLNRAKWLKMPDGTHYHVSAIPISPSHFTSEPAVYEEEFYYSTSKRIAPVIIGVGCIAGGIYFLVGLKILLYSIMGILLGVFFTYRGIRVLLDKTAQLKIARQGLWTKKLGYVPWTEIHKTKVLLNKTSDSEDLNLEIWLKNTAFAEAGKPDEVLNLSELKNGKYVEMVISNFSRPAADGAGDQT